MGDNIGIKRLVARLRNYVAFVAPLVAAICLAKWFGLLVTFGIAVWLGVAVANHLGTRVKDLEERLDKIEPLIKAISQETPR